MLKFTLALACALTVCSAISLPQLEEGGQHYAVLVAGSSGWGNYRHQADACHAYQVLRDHGVPADNIITMMVDDIAHNEENPTPGIIINHPKGHDVYAGVKIDYKGEEVTPDNFINVLTGDAKGNLGKGTGRVLTSTSKDHVFINFVDHGAPGLIAFPESELHARRLLKALKEMNNKGLYGQLVFYLESCESGSMFKSLPDDINIFATSAANGHESSYAVYFDKKRETYLGDVYSVKWMENSDTANLNEETLASQFNIVKKETNTSHCQEFGETTIAQEHVGAFLGKIPSARNVYYPHVEFDAVPTEDTQLYVYKHGLMGAVSQKEKKLYSQRIADEIEYRDSITEQMHRIARLSVKDDPRLFEELVSVRTEDIDFDCYERLVDIYKQDCQPINANTYALRVLYILQNICNEPERIPYDTVATSIRQICRV